MVAKKFVAAEMGRKTGSATKHSMALRILTNYKCYSCADSQEMYGVRHRSPNKNIISMVQSSFQPLPLGSGVITLI